MKGKNDTLICESRRTDNILTRFLYEAVGAVHVDNPSTEFSAPVKYASVAKRANCCSSGDCIIAKIIPSLTI